MLVATAREEARALRAGLDDSDPFHRSVKIPIIERLIAEIETWRSAHR